MLFVTSGVDRKQTAVVPITTNVGDRVPTAKLSKLEFKIMETLWAKSECSIREIQESLSEKKRPAYTTVQTTVYRMEAKGVVHRLKKVGNFHVFAPAISRESAQRRLMDEYLLQSPDFGRRYLTRSYPPVT